nr:unnamed protein product [Digitaria exilis]
MDWICRDAFATGRRAHLTSTATTQPPRSSSFSSLSSVRSASCAPRLPLLFSSSPSPCLPLHVDHDFFVAACLPPLPAPASSLLSTPLHPPE